MCLPLVSGLDTATFRFRGQRGVDDGQPDHPHSEARHPVAALAQLRTGPLATPPPQAGHSGPARGLLQVSHPRPFVGSLVVCFKQALRHGRTGHAGS